MGLFRKTKTEGADEDGPRRRGIPELVAAWRQDRTPFNEYVSRVAEAYQTSGLTITQASDWLDASEAEVWAVLKMGTLDDESLALFDGPPPPKTTWLDLADSTADGIKKALAALASSPDHPAPRRLVLEALEDIHGPSEDDRVAALPSLTLKHMADKAKRYGALPEKSQKALRSMANQKRFGKTLTPPQVAYVTSLLGQLVDNGAIKRDSPDGDQEKCDAVLDALGR